MTRDDNARQRQSSAGNSILVIRPYWHALSREPFVAGVPEMINRLVRGIPNAAAGFRLLFSQQPFPGHQAVFTRVREEYSGTWYREETSGSEGWLCPALFKYFELAPAKIYARAEAIKDDGGTTPP